MSEFDWVDGYHAELLTKEYAAEQEHAVALGALATLGTGRGHSVRYIRSESIGTEQFHQKWVHSVVATKDEAPVGYVLAYKRKAEGTPEYPTDTLFVSDVAVKPDQKPGLAEGLFGAFLFFNDVSTGLNYSVEVNAGRRAKPLVAFYESFGFTARSTVLHGNRTVHVLGRPR